MTVLGVDLGGTNIRVGKVEEGTIIKTASNLVPKNAETPKQVIDIIIATIYEVFDNEIEGIGIGIPSLVDREQGIVYDVQNIPSWKKVKLKEILENEFHVGVFLDNDANCFAIGEKLYGKGKNTDSFVGLAIGTGVGAGIINNGFILKDANCGSGEFGMLPYLDATYEDYCSGKFFIQKYNTSGGHLYKEAAKNNIFAIEIFKEFGKHLAEIIKAIMLTVDPQKVIIGGSVAKSNLYFEEYMWKSLADFPFKTALKNIKIEFSELENPAILGAAAVCLNSMNYAVTGKNFAIKSA